MTVAAKDGISGERVPKAALYCAFMPAISVENLSVEYRRGGEIIRAVDGVSFTGESGEVLGLLGPNGAGKTSTVETLEGYLKPSSGEVRVLGLDPIRDHQELMADVGVMLQQGGIQPGMRVIEALKLYAAYYDDPIEPYALIERMGLRSLARSSWRQLSGGEQQRLSLALALIGKPKIVFLDEPTSGLDVTGRHLVRQVIRDLCNEGVAVLLTTHELDEAQRIADRIVIIDHGQLIATGSPAELMNAGDATIRFAAPANLDVDTMTKELGSVVSEIAPGEYRLESAPSPQTIADLTAWLAKHDLALGDLRAGRHSLEDVFLRLTSNATQEETQ